MTVYTPPDNKFARCLFSLNHNVGSSLAGGTRVARTELSDPVWSVEVDTRVYFPKSEEARAWRVLRGQLRGGVHLLRLWDTTQLTPLAYPDAETPTNISGSWGGTGGVSSISGVSITVNSLPAYYAATAGDYIGLQQNNRYGLYEIAADAKANASGSINLTVATPLQTSRFTNSATARLWRPFATFMVEDSSWVFPAGVDPGPISFSGVQVI